MKKVLILAFLLFWLPVLFNQAPIFREDAAFISFPRLMACARQVSEGTLPLWDDLTFCGARPFYASLDTPVYYLPLYPFMWFSGGRSADTVWYISYVLPLALHILAAFLGAFFLFRFLEEKHYLPSCSKTDSSKTNSGTGKYALACGFFYAFSPVLIYAFRSLTSVFAFAWMPWALIHLIRIIDYKNNAKTRFTEALYACPSLYKAVLYTGLIILSGDLNLAVRCMFFLFLTALIYNPKAFKSILLVMFGACLLGLPALIGQIQGLSRMSSLGSSINPLGVISPGLMDIAAWICPAIYGYETGTTCFLSAWFFPVGQIIFMPGFFFFLLFIMGLYFSFRNEEPDNTDFKQQPCRPWFLGMSTGLLILAAFIPKLLLTFVSPAFLSGQKGFLMTLLYAPQPVYWLYPASLGAAVLACYGLKRLGSSESFTPMVRLGFLFITLVLGVLVLYSGYFARPYISVNKKVALNIESNEYTRLEKTYNYKQWVFTGPGGIPIVSSVLAAGILLVSLLHARRLYASNQRTHLFGFFSSAMFLLLIFEYILWAWIFLYRPDIYPETSAKGGYGRLFRRIAKKPSSHDFYAQGEHISRSFSKTQDKNFDNKKPQAGGSRFSGTASDIDHLAWVTGVPALTGYDCKPLFLPFAKVLVKAGLKPFYWMNTSLVPKTFLRNTGVSKRYSYSVTPNISRTVVGEYMYHDKGYVKSLDLVSRKLSGGLDFVYFQKNYEILGADKCIEKTVFSDLDSCIVIEQTEFDLAMKNPCAPAKLTTKAGKPSSSEEPGEDKPQEIRIIQEESDRSVIKAKLKSDGFLVINSCWDENWKAVVNNAPCRLVRLNSFMQGLYLKKGDHTIELVFRHLWIYFGFAVSIFMFLICIFFLKRRGKSK